jgi:hypothetical protein
MDSSRYLRSVMRPLRRALACGVAISMLALPPGASGFSTLGSADLVTQPNNFYSFDGSELTWKFSNNFLTAFPNAQLHTQVRLAFQEWSIASASALRRDSPRYHWVRSNGLREVYDLRSTVTHEIGHVLGSQHPDASWFNSNLQKNFRYDDGDDLIAAPPFGGEIMNEGFEPGTLPNSKPGPGISRGEYWRTVSKDELLFLDYVYNRQLTFKEVSGNTPADIIVTAYNLDGQSNSTALGQGGVDDSERRDQDDATQGRRILAASLTVNANPGFAHGIDPATGSWDVVNQTGQGIDRLSIRTEGTSNRQPLLVVLSNDPDNFTDYEPSNAFGIFDFENVGHIFSHSPGNSVPAGGTFGIGLQQDVWDWFVTAATAHTTGGDLVPLSLVTFVPFYQLGLAPPAPAPNAPSSILVKADEPPILARGLKLVNSGTPTTLSAILFADVEGAQIQARDVHAKTWQRLVRQGRVQDVRIAPFTLGPGDEFYVLFEGDVTALPADVLARGNYVVVRVPGLLDRKILASARSADANFLVQSFGLINDDPITSRARHREPPTTPRPQ